MPETYADRDETIRLLMLDQVSREERSFAQFYRDAKSYMPSYSPAEAQDDWARYMGFHHATPTHDVETGEALS